ncbi:MAG: hypothetical protein LQ344_003377 [Seirophora lacunosa]|nr:MAG: hypothetical protein LQ344_003377 [Seirophora lacunosa]
MASGDPAAPGRAQGRARPTPGQLQTGETHTRNQRFSWLETPVEVQRPTFQQFSSPANSIIDESPISPPDAYQNWHTHQQAHALPSLTEQKAHPERTGSPYNLPAPTETHPAYFAPVVEETQPAQSELRQPVATDTKETLEDVKSSINAPTPKPLSHPRKESAVVLKPDGDGSTLVYNPKSLAGPNAALENHRPGQAAHPNAAVEPEWKHGLCLLASIQRARVRKLYHLNGSFGSDCLKSLCCCCCVLMQDEREVRDREDLIRRHAGPASTAYTTPPAMTYAPPPR